MDKRFMVLLHPSFLREGNHTDEALNLALRISFQLVHPSLDDQGNTFRGCDCHIERYHQQRGQRHKTLPKWARQLGGLIHRWLPGREVVMVTDISYAVIELLKQVSDTPGMSLITRLRLDAALYDPAPPRVARQHGRPWKKGARRPTLPHLLKAAPTQWSPLTASHWYGGGAREIEVGTDTAVWYHTGLPPIAVRRWTMEVTFEEARTHLGLETQRQWNDLASGRTTPTLFGLYSLVALMAHALRQTEPPVVRTAAWYAKVRSTFSDALAVVRRELWSACHFSMSSAQSEIIEIPRSL